MIPKMIPRMIPKMIVPIVPIDMKIAPRPSRVAPVTIIAINGNKKGNINRLSFQIRFVCPGRQPCWWAVVPGSLEGTQLSQAHSTLVPGSDWSGFPASNPPFWIDFSNNVR